MSKSKGKNSERLYLGLFLYIYRPQNTESAVDHVCKLIKLMGFTVERVKVAYI